jgi:hypothetical protein
MSTADSRLWPRLLEDKQRFEAELEDVTAKIKQLECRRQDAQLAIMQIDIQLERIRLIARMKKRHAKRRNST